MDAGGREPQDVSFRPVHRQEAEQNPGSSPQRLNRSKCSHQRSNPST